MEVAEFQTLRREALTRRAGKLISWLQRPDYGVYVDENSIPHLIKLIDLIEWALENSLPLEDWRPFRSELYAARNSMLKLDNEANEQANYEAAILAVIATLRSYSEYINK